MAPESPFKKAGLITVQGKFQGGGGKQTAPPKKTKNKTQQKKKTPPLLQECRVHTKSDLKNNRERSKGKPRRKLRAELQAWRKNFWNWTSKTKERDLEGPIIGRGLASKVRHLLATGRREVCAWG